MSQPELQQMNSVFVAFLDHFIRPDGTLNFSNVCFPQEEHTDSGLTDTASDSVWKLLVENCFLEWKLSSFSTAGLFKLGLKRVLINSDTHT